MAPTSWARLTYSVDLQLVINTGTSNSSKRAMSSRRAGSPLMVRFKPNGRSVRSRIHSRSSRSFSGVRAFRVGMVLEDACFRGSNNHFPIGNRNIGAMTIGYLSLRRWHSSVWGSICFSCAMGFARDYQPFHTQTRGALPAWRKSPSRILSVGEGTALQSLIRSPEVLPITSVGKCLVAAIRRTPVVALRRLLRLRRTPQGSDVLGEGRVRWPRRQFLRRQERCDLEETRKMESLPLP